MTFEPLISAPVQVQIHVVFAALALLLGPIALFRRRRDRLHKISGYAGLVAMTGLAVTGLFIESGFPVIAHFGPIHALCVLALWGVVEGIQKARTRDFIGHQATMTSLWYGAIGVTGLLTFLPGRVMNRVLFGAPSDLGYLVMALGGAGLAWLYLSQRRSGPRSDKLAL